MVEKENSVQTFYFFQRRHQSRRYILQRQEGADRVRVFHESVGRLNQLSLSGQAQFSDWPTSTSINATRKYTIMLVISHTYSTDSQYISRSAPSLTNFLSIQSTASISLCTVTHRWSYLRFSRSFANKKALSHRHGGM